MMTLKISWCCNLSARTQLISKSGWWPLSEEWESQPQYKRVELLVEVEVLEDDLEGCYPENKRVSLTLQTSCALGVGSITFALFRSLTLLLEFLAAVIALNNLRRHRGPID